MWELPWRFKVGVVLSTLVAVLGFAAVGFVHIGYLADFQYSLSTTGESVGNAGDSATIRTRLFFDDDQARSVRVILAEPLTDDAVPPPGLDHWPEAGHFLVSPDLESRADVLSARWGVFDGVLDETGLPAVNAHAILARPLTPMAQKYNAIGFITDVSGFRPDFFTLNPVPFAAGLVSFASMITLPAMLLFLAAVYRVVYFHSRRARVVETIGLTPYRIHRGIVGELLPSFLCGCFVGLVLLAPAFVTNIPLPFADFVIRAYDSQHFWYILLSYLFGGIIVLALVGYVCLYPKRTSRTVRKLKTHGRMRGVKAFVGIVVTVLLLQSIVEETTRPGRDFFGGRLALEIGVGVLVAALCLPAITGILLSLIGQCVTWCGKRFINPTCVLVGRSLDSARSSSRVTSAVAILIVIVGVAGSFSALATGSARVKQDVIKAVDQRYVKASIGESIGRDEDTGSIEDALGNLPEGLSYLIFDFFECRGGDQCGTNSSGRSMTLEISGTPASLNSLSLSANDNIDAQALPHYMGALFPSDTPVTIHDSLPETLTPPPSDPSHGRARSFLIFALDGSRVDQVAVQRALSEMGGPAWEVRYGDESHIVGRVDEAHALRWAPWCLTIGGFILLASLWLRTSEDQRLHGRRIAPIDVLYAARSHGSIVLFTRMAIMSALGVMMGGGIATLYAQALHVQSGSTNVIVTLSITAFVFSLALCVPITVSITRHTRHWLPGAHNE